MEYVRSYSVESYPEEEKKIFSFLIEQYNFKLIDKRERIFSYLSIYRKKDIRVFLNYDYREQWFIFKLIKGKSTPDHSDIDDENIKMFWDLFMYFEPDFDYMRTQPDKNQYLDSLKLNAELLQKYGDKLLKGEEWYW